MKTLLIERESQPVEIVTPSGPRSFRLEEMTGADVSTYLRLCLDASPAETVNLMRAELGTGTAPEEALQKAGDAMTTRADQLLRFILRHPLDGLGELTEAWLAELSTGQRRQLIAAQDRLNRLEELSGNMKALAAGMTQETPPAEPSSPGDSGGTTAAGTSPGS